MNYLYFLLEYYELWRNFAAIATLVGIPVAILFIYLLLTYYRSKEEE